MPGITARICGICPVSHLLASAKAGDALLAVEIPPAAAKLRRLMNLGQIVQSPRAALLPPLRARPPARLRRRPGEAQHLRPDRGRTPSSPARGIRLRQFGQEIIETLGGKKIHPAWAVPGGVASRSPRRAATASGVAARGAGDDRAKTLDLVQARCWTATRTRRRSSATSPRCSWAWSTPDGGLEHYDGKLRFVDATGQRRRRPARPADVPRVHRRGGRAVVLPEVPVLQAARLPRRHLPRRPAGAAQRRIALRHAAGRPRARRVPPARARRRALRRSTTTTPG